MTPRTLAVAALFAAAALPASAQSGARPTPTVERGVRPGAVGPNRLALDLPLLTAASPLEVDRAGMPAATGGGLGDLRLSDASGREVPYLLVWPTARRDERWRPTQIVLVAPGKDTSGFEAELGAPLTVDRIDISGLPDRFLKRVRVEGSGDRVRWTMLVPEGTLFNLPGDGDHQRPLRQTQLAFAPGEYRYLRVIWDDHAGGRLPGSLGATVRVAPPGRRAVDSLRVALPVERRAGQGRTSLYHVVLPASHLPVIALELDVADPLVLRAASVTEQRGGGSLTTAGPIGAATLRRVTAGDAVAANLRIPIDMPSGAVLDLVVDDGDNPPLDVRAIRAVLAPLPYIYFNSTDGQPLRATYGDHRRSIAAPRYDLEALRDTVDQIAAATATWDAPRPTTTAEARDTTTPKALYAAPGATLDVKSFPFARAIPEGSGLTAIRLDAAALAHSSVNDLRIVDAEGHQVPYVLDLLEEPTQVKLPALVPAAPREDVDHRLVPDAATRSWYRVSLPYAGLPNATLRLGTNARVFERDVAVVTRPLLRDEQPGAGYGYTMTGRWANADPDAAAAPLDLFLGNRLPADSLFVLVGDGDNQKLPLTSATLLLPSYRLRFFRAPGTTLTLLYGRPDLPKPSYDLELLTPRLLDAAAQDVVVAPETGHPQPNSRVAGLVFWSVLAAAVLVLLVMIARLVRNGPIGQLES